MSTMSSTITTNIAASPPGSRRTLRIGFHVRAGYAGAGFLSLFRRFLCAVDCFLLVSEVRFPFSCRFSGLSVSRSVYACFRTGAGNLPNPRQTYFVILSVSEGSIWGKVTDSSSIFRSSQNDNAVFALNHFLSGTHSCARPGRLRGSRFQREPAPGAKSSVSERACGTCLP